MSQASIALSSPSFAEDVLEISKIYEQIQKLQQNTEYGEVIGLIRSNSDLLVRNWQAALCMTALSHDMFTTQCILKEILNRFDVFQSNELFKFLMNLDRTLEIDGMQQIVSIVRVRKDQRFMLMLARWRATRLLLQATIEDDMQICILNKSNVPCYINHH